jgi:hypothetical protein
MGYQEIIKLEKHQGSQAVCDREAPFGELTVAYKPQQRMENLSLPQQSDSCFPHCQVFIFPIDSAEISLLLFSIFLF